MLQSKLTFKDVFALNGKLVKVTFNNGNTERTGFLSCMFGTMIQLTEVFDDVEFIGEYDLRDIENIEEEEI